MLRIKHLFIFIFIALFVFFFYLKYNWKKSNLPNVKKLTPKKKLSKESKSYGTKNIKNSAEYKDSFSKQEAYQYFINHKLKYNSSVLELKKWKKKSLSKIKLLQKEDKFKSNLGFVYLLKSTGKVSFTRGGKKIDLYKDKGNFSCRTKKNSKAFFYFGKRGALILYSNGLLEFRRKAGVLKKIILYRGSLSGWFNFSGGADTAVYTPFFRITKSKSASIFLTHKKFSVLALFDGKVFLKNKKNSMELSTDSIALLKSNKSKFKKILLE